MPQEVTLTDLRRNLVKSTEEALDESDYLTREEVEEMIDEMVDEDRLDDGEEDEEDAEKVLSWDELREQLPDDIYDAVRSHLEESDEPDSPLERTLKSLSGEGPDIVAKESDATSGKSVSEAAMSRFEHHRDG